MGDEKNLEYRRFILSLIPPAIILLILWLVKIVEVADGLELFYYGIFPRRIDGLIGILASPFIHANFNHLINNSVPFFFLLTAVFYFYQAVAWRVLSISYILTGILVWIFARSSYHVGASGLIYSFAAFLFVSGIVRRNLNLLAISLLVIFLYGSMVWGIFPYRPDMSFESHLIGTFIGIMLAIYYRHEGPPPTMFISDMEDDEEDDEEEEEEEKDEGEVKSEEGTHPIPMTLHPLITHYSSLITLHSLLITHYSSRFTHSSLITTSF